MIRSLLRPVAGARVALATAVSSVLLAGSVFSPAVHAASAGFTALSGSVQATTDADVGEYSASNMSVTLVLAPSNASQIGDLLSSLYEPTSPAYKQWLATGEFESRFAPSANEVSLLTAYLQSSGLKVSPGASPFFLRVSGSSAAIAGAFKTSLHNYVNRQGISYFANASAVEVPANLASSVQGVVGLTNTVRLHSHAVRPNAASTTNCETGYVTRAELYAAVNNGTGFAYGYGGGPGCSGLTPSQVNSIYEAPSAGLAARGLGATLAVFELSAYQQSDIDTWVHQFYGANYSPPLQNVIVDGGPLNPICPTGDTCPAQYEFYSGDIEVDADIEMQLAVAPAAKSLLVYEAPNDFTGQTEIDNYTRIAHDNMADSISSSWGACENDAGAADAKAENMLFIQMALQGQSIFASAGDTGAFDCIRSDGTDIVDIGDPGEPYITVVGGTSLTVFNPGRNATPTKPANAETVWNVDNLCNESTDEGNQTGYFWCGATGAGGGGVSQFWGRPSWQTGPGVNNPYTSTTNCTLAASGTPCRETPDVSADADAYTPYAEFCTGSSSTPYSVCATISTTPAGWFGIGGTSLSSPLWSAIIADRVSFTHHRVGNASALLYRLFNMNASEFFNDITGNKLETNNGLYPTTAGYDLATGIGSPRMSAVITGQPQL